MDDFFAWMDRRFEITDNVVVCRRCGLREVYALTKHCINIHKDDASLRQRFPARDCYTPTNWAGVIRETKLVDA
jgi:hypothetical protein